MNRKAPIHNCFVGVELSGVCVPSSSASPPVPSQVAFSPVLCKCWSSSNSSYKLSSCWWHSPFLSRYLILLAIQSIHSTSWGSSSTLIQAGGLHGWGSKWVSWQILQDLRCTQDSNPVLSSLSKGMIQQNQTKVTAAPFEPQTFPCLYWKTMRLRSMVQFLKAAVTMGKTGIYLGVNLALQTFFYLLCWAAPRCFLSDPHPPPL